MQADPMQSAIRTSELSMFEAATRPIRPSPLGYSAALASAPSMHGR